MLDEALRNSFAPVDPWIVQFTVSIMTTLEKKIEELNVAIAGLIESMPGIKHYVDLFMCWHRNCPGQRSQT